MIRLIQGHDSEQYPREMEAMFRARAAVFHRRLGWNVTVRKGREVDRYDAENPLYVIAVDDDRGEVAGSARLIPTTGPKTYGESFSDLFEEPIDLASATVWECARFCIHPAVRASGSLRNAMRVSFEINLAVCEVGLRAGLTQIQTVYDQFMLKVYQHAPWRPMPIARSTRIGKLPAYVGVWDVTQRTLSELRKASGIDRSVLEAAPVATLREVS
ncbi:MAG TPA: acyl-homoserine-lactone synthase [Pseudolabrys sp.]|jgi:acyl homoserine lactone synthase|nr:acyl-homoserine-lactone synthase [Pseudolabrys sp.]